jgi:hypothetical protein
MDDQNGPVIQPHQNILRPPPHRFDPPPGQARDEIRRKGRAQVRPVLIDTDQNPPFEMRGKPPADGFNFGKLRHGRQGGGKADGRQGGLPRYTPFKIILFTKSEPQLRGSLYELVAVGI